MALTKVKLDTMVTGNLPDANIPNNITIDTASAAPASGLTGNTLASGVTASSLTSVGTLTGLTVSGNITTTGTGSDVITGDYLYLDAPNNTNAKNLVFRQLDDTWLGQIEFHPTSTAQIVTRVNQPLALGVNNSQKVTIGTDGNTTFAGAVQVNDNDLTVKMNNHASGIRVNVDRKDTNDFGGFEVRTGGSQRWFVGMRELGNDDLQFFNGNSSSGSYQNVLSLNHSNANATFAEGVAINGASIGSHKLVVDNGTTSLNRGNSGGDILDVRGLNASQFSVTTTATTVGKRFYVTANLDGGFGTELYNAHVTGHGLKVRGGNSSSQYAFYVTNYDQTVALFQVLGNGDTDLKRDFYAGANRVNNPWDLTSGEGALYFQSGVSNRGQTLALANNQDRGYAVMYSNAINADASDGRHIQWMNDGTPAGHVHFNSSNSVAYNTTQSDKTLKKNFANWTENVLDSFDKINPQLFHFKIQEDSEEKVKGFIAQEMIDKFPEAYPMGAYGEGDNKTTKYHFNPSGMVVYLMKAVQELSAEIKILKGS